MLSVRDFQQIAGRAGRKGFDDRGIVVVQAPEHVIENLRLAEKAARDGRKMAKRQARPSSTTCTGTQRSSTRLTTAPPEPLVSRFEVSHGMLLNVLSRRGDGCLAMRRLIRDSHETPAPQDAAPAHGAWQLFRALVGARHRRVRGRRGARLAPARQRRPAGRLLAGPRALALPHRDACPLLDASSPTYALDVLTLVESILENPELILRRQLDRIKGLAVAQMKADGVEYDERMAELEKLEYPKPLRDFVYDTFNAFVERHPWVEQETIRPKSIAREMFETYKSFAEYVREYDLRALGGAAAAPPQQRLQGAQRRPCPKPARPTR